MFFGNPGASHKRPKLGLKTGWTRLGII